MQEHCLWLEIANILSSFKFHLRHSLNLPGQKPAGKPLYEPLSMVPKINQQLLRDKIDLLSHTVYIKGCERRALCVAGSRSSAAGMNTCRHSV